MKSGVLQKNKIIISAVAAFLHLISAEYISAMSGDTGVYYGTGIFSFMPESIMVFVICILMLGRFFDEKILCDRQRVTASVILGVMTAFGCVWGQYILYEITLFDNASKIVTAFFHTIGFSIFTVPLASEIIGLLKMTDVSESFVPKNVSHHRLRYGILIGIICFISYIPLYLYVWPINLIGDSFDELYAQILGNRTTHNTVIHGLMLRKAYILGLKLGNPSYGFAVYSVFQMILMSISIACVMLYLYDRRVAKKTRIIVFLLFFLNPVNAYFAVTAEKGTMGFAFAMCGMVALLRMLDEESGEGIGDRKKWMINAVLFIVLSSIGCLFRNNLIYAFVLGGLLISILKKGTKQKLIMLVTVLLLLGAYRMENAILIKVEDSRAVDSHKESLAYPIMCLARVAIEHEEDMPKELYDSILEFIPAEGLEAYSISVVDGVKTYISEESFKGNTGRFMLLFLKCGLKYPGDYIDQLGWLTYGYWNPYRTFILGSTTPYFARMLPEGIPNVEKVCLNPLMKDFYDKIYLETERFTLPLFAWFYRGAIYFWSVIFLLVIGAVKKSRRMVCISAIPFFHIVTVLAGPLCQFRYLYFNVLTLPLILFALFEGLGKNLDSHKK